MDCKVYIIFNLLNLTLTTVIIRYVTIILFVHIHFIVKQLFVRISEMLGVWSHRPHCRRQAALLPQGWGKRFFGYPCYFLNTTRLGCLFAENSLPMDKTHICL